MICVFYSVGILFGIALNAENIADLFYCGIDDDSGRRRHFERMRKVFGTKDERKERVCYRLSCRIGTSILATGRVSIWDRHFNSSLGGAWTGGAWVCDALQHGDGVSVHLQ